MATTDLELSAYGSRKTEVLIVDDSMLMRSMIHAAVDEETCNVRMASDGTQALEMIDELLPHIVLLDEKMPGLGGNEILRFLKDNERTRDIMIIMVTSNSDAKNIEESLSLGAVEFIAKPFSQSVLKARINNVVRTSLLVREQGALRKAAEQSNKSKSEFLANMSHEIRTPMTAILGFTELMIREETESGKSDLRVERLSTIQRNGQYLLEIINDILDLAKIESCKLEIEKIKFSPREILTDVSTLMVNRAKAQGLTMRVEYDGPIPTHVVSDPTRLRQILINLVGNAIKFSEAGEIRVVVKLQDVGADEPKLHFDIVDSGIGMTEDQTNKLFQPFVQADVSTTRKYGGTGLGLTISKHLVEMLGGEISVTSIQDQGSTFSFEVATGSLLNIPIVEGGVSESSSESKDEKSQNDEVALDCRILLAEDGPDNQRLISFYLKEYGADVTLAKNGKVAFDLASEAMKEGKPFDVVLMDMQMPVLDGYTATTYLREAGYRWPIIALTACAMSNDRDKCIDAGCDDYATKPIDRPKLISVVAKYAAQKRPAGVSST